MVAITAGSVAAAAVTAAVGATAAAARSVGVESAAAAGAESSTVNVLSDTVADTTSAVTGGSAPVTAAAGADGAGESSDGEISTLRFEAGLTWVSACVAPGSPSSDGGAETFTSLAETVVFGDSCGVLVVDAEPCDAPAESSLEAAVDAAAFCESDPADDGELLLDDVDPAPDEEPPESSSACAMPEPVASAAPTPRVIAPAPSHP
jgi:hypothetical protein